MTQKTGREQAQRKHDHPVDAKQLHSPLNFKIRSPKDRTALKLLKQGHKHWTFNRRISG